MGTSTQVTQNTTTNIPDYAAPYFNDLLNRADAESHRQYVPYGYTTDPKTGQVVPYREPEKNEDGTIKTDASGNTVFKDYDPSAFQRIAEFTPDQLRTQKNVMRMKSPGQFGMATNAMGSGLAALARTQGYSPAQFQAMMAQAQQVNAQQVNAGQVGAERVTAPELQQYMMRGPQEFGQEQAQKYMSPYIQNVLDIQKREAATDAQKSQLAQNLNASRMGTYGGARQLLATTERERALGQQMGDIQYRGLQSGYENAQGQFERDRAARLGVDTTNLNALLGVQQLGAGMQMQGSLANQQTGLQAGLANQQTGLQAGLANQQSALQAAQGNQQYGLQAALANQQANLEAQRLGESSRQFGANLGLQGAQAYGQFGQTYANIGAAQQQADLQRLNAQNAVGAQQQALQQQKYDINYGDFQRQQQYPIEQLNYLGNILRGVPIQSNTSTTTSGPAPNPWAQAAGTGLTALSYAKLWG